MSSIHSFIHKLTFYSLNYKQYVNWQCVELN